MKKIVDYRELMVIPVDAPEEAVDITSSQRISVIYPAGGSSLEATVSDLETVEQLRDLVQGFESQNLFLNQEILGWFGRMGNGIFSFLSIRIRI